MGDEPSNPSCYPGQTILVDGPFDPRAIGNLVLDLGDKHGRPVTHLALQKIIYFLHGWHLASFDEPLVSEEPEAWTHGPVFRTVYQSFSQCRRENIVSRASVFDYFEEKDIYIRPNLDATKSLFLEKVAIYYFSFSASSLRRISHQKNGPWDIVIEAARRNSVGSVQISNALIRKHFLSSGAGTSKTVN